MSYPDPKPAQFTHVRAPGARLAAVMTAMCGRRVSWHKVVDAEHAERATCVKCAVRALISSTVGV